MPNLLFVKLRSFSFVLLALLIGNTAAIAESTKKSAIWTSGRTFVVAFAQDTMRNDWRMAQVQELKDALSPYPFIQFKYSDAKGKTANQILDIERFIDEKVDVLVTSPINAIAMAPVVSRAYKKGIPVVLLSRSVTTPDYTVFITGDNFAIGKKAAAFIAGRLKGKGNILMLEGISTSSTAKARADGFIKGLEAHKGLKISYRKHADYLRGKAIKVIEEALAKNIPFDAIYAHSDSMVTGARMALKKAGKDLGSYVIVGIDYITEAQGAIISGEQSASFTYQTYGKEGAHYIIKILKGETVPKDVIADSIMVTIKNADAVKPIF